MKATFNPQFLCKKYSCDFNSSFLCGYKLIPTANKKLLTRFKKCIRQRRRGCNLSAFFCYPVKTAISRPRTSSVIKSSETWPAILKPRALTSRALICESNRTPDTGNPSGKATSSGLSFVLEVTGTTQTIPPILVLKLLTETTSAGLWPFCSCPAVGEKSNQIIEP